MFYHPPSIIIYLKWSSLEIYRNSKPIGSIEFPVEIVSHLEILDQAALEKLLTEFFKKQPIAKEDSMVILSERTIFYKSIPKVKNGNEGLRENILAFFDAVPFGPETVAKKILNVPEGVQLLAANRRLILLIKGVYEQFGGKMRIASADVFFGQLNEVLSQQALKQIQSSGSKLEKANFLQDDFDEILQKVAPGKEPLNSGGSTTRRKASKSRLFLLLILLFILIGGSLFILWRRGIIKPSQFSQLNALQQRISAKPSLTTTPAVRQSTPTKAAQAVTSDAEKRTLKVQILNGSGVAGQASIVRDELQKIGYADFELGNAPETSSESAVFVSSKINQPTFEELYSTLSDILPNVKKIDETDDPSFDIVVITGEQ